MREIICEDIYTIELIRDKLKPVFDKTPVHRAILFGSYARGDAVTNSDVDIVIDSRGELHGINFFGVLEDVVTALGKDVDLIELSEIKPDSPIMDIVEKQGVILYDR